MVSHKFENDIATYISLNCLDSRDIKVPFGFNLPPLVDSTYANNELSEQMGSGVQSIGANCVKIGICKQIADFYKFLT
jgi:hypothetical protein